MNSRPFPLTLCAATVTASVFLAGCGGPIGHIPEETVSAQPEQQQTAAAPPVAAPTPEPAPLAPDGTFFLLQRTAVMTSQGIEAYPAGTMIREVAPGLYDIKGELQELEPDQVTNNLEHMSEFLAKQRAQVHAAHQARIRAAQPKPAPTPEPTPESEPVISPTPPPVASQPPPPAPVINHPVDSGEALGSPVTAASEATPEEKVATRTYDTDSGMRYHIRVRGADVTD